MPIAYFDCASGISGDMTIGSFLDAGMPLPYLQRELEKLNLESWKISAEKVNRAGIEATKFNVIYQDQTHERHLSEILSIIKNSTLNNNVKKTAEKIFQVLGEAEAKVHGTSIEEVHFHEVGAIDAIIDIVSTAIALDYFKTEKVFHSAVNVGNGKVKAAHGEIRVPVPAVVELLKNRKTYSDGEIELTTPTGAAILAALGEEGQQPAKVKKTGYGAGTKELKSPNVLRIVIGQE